MYNGKYVQKIPFGKFANRLKFSKHFFTTIILLPSTQFAVNVNISVYYCSCQLSHKDDKDNNMGSVKRTSCSCTVLSLVKQTHSSVGNFCGVYNIQWKGVHVYSHFIYTQGKVFIGREQ